MNDAESQISNDAAAQEHWRRVDAVLGAVLEREPDEQAAYLNEACAQDADLRAEVESLLGFKAQAGAFIETPVVALAPDVFSEAIRRERVGTYKLLREIGRGGMGEVFLAVRDDDVFKKQVAVKIVRRGMDTNDILRRFRHERQILAGLEHPHITRLLDGGTTEDGLPYLVMEYVEGQPLAEYCDRCGLTTDERLRLFLKVCAAVQFAHQNLIVHRDLKPSNILVTADGTPKLLDFGIAKVLSPELSGQTIHPTLSMLRLLTPDYASPEQVRGERITTASDVYSLGVILYELLTGQRPYHATSGSAAEMARMVCEQEPPLPSKAWQARSATARETKTSAQSASRASQLLKGDLDNIALRALRKEPLRRYASAAQLAEDIQRRLDGLPVRARRDTFTYRANKFITRHKAGTAAAALILLSLLGGIIATARQARVAQRERDHAQAAQISAERINKFLRQMLSFSNQSITSVAPVAQTKNVTVNEMLDQIAPQVETEFADQPEIRAQLLRTIGAAYASQGIYAQAEKNYRLALATQTQILGEENAETAATLTELGVLSYRQGKLEEANRLLEKAIAFYRKQQRENASGFSPAKLALALDYLGAPKFYLGDVKAATALMSEAFQIAANANLQGDERAVLTFIKADYGGLLVSVGEAEKGETLLRESLAEQRRLHREPRWEQAATLLFLGVNAQVKNQLDEAERLLTESEQIFRATLGNENGYLAQSLDRQAIVLSLKKDFAAAEPKAREALAIVRKSFPGNKFAAAVPMIILGVMLNGNKHFDESENYLREGLQELEQAAAKNHLYIVQGKISLSEGLRLKNRLAEAERVALDAHTEARQYLGEQSPYIKAAADILIKIYERQGKPELADKYRAPAK